MTYNKKIVAAYFKSFGIPEPDFEYLFHPKRKWRFDMCWHFERGGVKGFCPADWFTVNVYLEVQGGIWIKGGHNRGAQMKKDWEKYNAATEMGWRPLFVEPKDLMTKATAEMIRRALCLG